MVINLGNSLVDAFGQRKCEKWGFLCFLSFGMTQKKMILEK